MLGRSKVFSSAERENNIVKVDYNRFNPSEKIFQCCNFENIIWTGRNQDVVKKINLQTKKRIIQTNGLPPIFLA